MGMGGGGFRAAAIGGGGFRSAAIGGAVSVRSGNRRRADFVAALLRSTVFAAVSTPGSGIVQIPVVAVGVGLGYGLYGCGYDDYYGYG